ncbi:relaxase/mobilization nuclease domain-containing protein [Fibrella aquatilis]|uniref:Relaxase/mobilization nuclease domain-containing protein n=1 Tax=Fibrella aquatilis TaxID=2817059 RepID=A0A939G8T1_9BACT|nr:relaxase/mobilization nuclease domain-containing protein [Fibrella aquatilis]MBO0931908.1 relaxase/mobilization nuclease domain-containing protein [Fibrella aquatilis]
MIGKIARFGSSFLGAIQYCYYETRANRSLDRTRIRGELLYAQHVGLSQVTDNSLRTESKQRLDIHALAASMKSVAELNERTRKPVWHQSFSFPVGESPSADVLIRICQSFAQTFGMENNPMVAFRHRDRQHDHFHIIASRIDLEGLNTAQTSFNYREVGRFCRTMETRFNLTPGTPMATDQKATVVDTDPTPAENKQANEGDQTVPGTVKPAPVHVLQQKLKP